MIADLMRSELDRIRAEAHPGCVVCSASNGRGLELGFDLQDDGTVRASFDCDKAYEGYSGLLHGGVVSALLDGAMTNCMFARGCAVVTVELNVRFLDAVRTDRPSTVHAWIERSQARLHVLRGEIRQDNEVKATARGKFMRLPGAAHGDIPPRGRGGPQAHPEDKSG